MFGNTAAFCFAAQLGPVRSDPAEKPCLRPFLATGSPRPYLFVRLFGTLLAAPYLSEPCPYAAHTRSFGRASHKSDRRAHTECWGHPNSGGDDKEETVTKHFTEQNQIDRSSSHEQEL